MSSNLGQIQDRIKSRNGVKSTVDPIEIEAEEVFAGVVFVFETGVEERMDTVLEAGSDDYELSRSLVSALGLASLNKTVRRERYER